MELADEKIEKKIKTNNGETTIKKKKLKTVPLEEYEDEMCLNCGS